MLQDLEGPPANPSSVHTFGQRARNLLSSARASVASFFHAKPEEILFTSGGTESIHLMLKSIGPQGHIITTNLEHSAVYESTKGAIYIPVGLWGAPTPEQIEQAIRPDTRAIILSASNSETGVKLDLEAIAKIAQQRNIFLFIDAVSYIGKEPWIHHPGISGIALSGHKFHAPKGVGALYLKSGIKLSPTLLGGGQEGGRRAGTENLSGILGLAEALKILQEDSQIPEKIRDLRDYLENGLLREIPDIAINGHGPRVSNVSNIAFAGIDGETLLLQLDLAGIAASHGSACSAGALEPSRVLTNMGLDRKTARSSLRLSVSRMNTREEMDLTIDAIAAIVKRLRSLTA